MSNTDTNAKLNEPKEWDMKKVLFMIVIVGFLVYIYYRYQLYEAPAIEMPRISQRGVIPPMRADSRGNIFKNDLN